MDIKTAAQKYFENKTQENCSYVIQAAEPLVRHFARLYGGNCCFEDLYQTGMEGLLKALATYSPQRSTAFSTWASECIISAIRHYVRKEASYIRPGCIIELQAKVDRIIEQNLRYFGEIPTAKTIAEELHVTENSVHEVMRAGMVSVEDIDVNNIKTLQYTSFHLPIEDSIVLAQAMSRLSTLQRKVIKALFFTEMTQQQVAKQLGINQKKVSRLKLSGLQAMAENIEETSPNQNAATNAFAFACRNQAKSKE